MNGMDYQRNSGSFCSQSTDEAGFAAVSVDDVGTKVFELTNQVTVGKKIPEWMNRMMSDGIRWKRPSISWTPDSSEPSGPMVGPE